MSDALRILHGNFGRAVLVRTNQPMAEHAHRTCQLLFKIDGPDISVTVGRDRCPLDQDKAILLNAWETHSLQVVAGGAPVRLLGLHLEPSWLRSQSVRLALSMHPKFFSTPCGPIAPRVRDAVRDLADLITLDNQPDAGEVELRILEIVFSLTAHYTDVKALSSFEIAGGLKCDHRIRNALLALQESIGTRVSPDDLAKNLGMSRPHFFQLFKRETRLTPMGYLNMLRLESAFRRVGETRDSLLNVSLDLGFDSPGNFSRFFSKNNGITPSQYRRNLTLIA